MVVPGGWPRRGLPPLVTLLVDVFRKGWQYLDKTLFTSPPSIDPTIAGARPAILATIYLLVNALIDPTSRMGTMAVLGVILVGVPVYYVTVGRKSVGP